MINKIKELKIQLINSELPILRVKAVKSALTLVLTRNFIRYLIIGTTTFIIQIFLLFVFTQIFNFGKFNGNIVSTLLSIIFNFLMSNYWTFKAGSSSQGRKLSKYLLLAIFNYLFDTVIAFPLLAITLGINQYLTKMIITGIIVGWNYFLYKLWVFKN